MSVTIENILYVGANIKLVETMLNVFHGNENKPTYKTNHLFSCIDMQAALAEHSYNYFICEQAISSEDMDKIKNQYPQLKTFYLADSEVKKEPKKVSLRAEDLISEDVQVALDAISIPIYYRNKKRVFIACNIAFAQLLGLLPEQVVGKHFLEIFPRTILDDIREVKKTDSADHQVTLYSGNFHNQAGIPREMELRLEALSERNMFIGMIFDVQERNDAKRLLEKEQARLRATADISSLLIFFKDLDSRFLGCNKPFEKFIGCSEKELIGQTDESFFTLEQATSCQVQDEKVMTENTVFCSEEYLTSHTGERHFVKMKKVPILAKDGSVQGLIAVAQDITAKNILRKNLNVANVVFENSKDSIIVTDARGKIISANNSASQIFGYLNKRLLAEDIRLLYTDNHGVPFYKSIEASLKSDKRWQGEVSYTTQNGDVYFAWLEIYVVEHIDEGTLEKIYSYTDLTQFQSEQERILFLSKHDPQTGLYNRVALFHRL
ncbi:MAG: PAS domain S-box protein, partial [Psychromonas sp.]